MANILDYMIWRGDLTFEERPFNEVDNLIFTEFAYLAMDGIVPGMADMGIEMKSTAEKGIAITDGEMNSAAEKDYRMTVGDICRRYRQEGRSQSDMINDPGKMLDLMEKCPRFRTIRTDWFVNEIDQEKQIQFSAVTFWLDKQNVFVAYRGTDSTIVGWREDFTISYLCETPGQKEAVRYLNRVMEKTCGTVRIGGHSKGGNLAVYAAAFCEEKYKDRIVCVYSNDGPGFNQMVTQTDQYRKTLEKVQLTVPETSVVGILLSNPERRKVVKSSARGSMQHDPFSWQVGPDAFELVDTQSEESLFLDGTINRWLDQVDDGQKKEFVTTIFDLLDSSGAVTLSEINEDKWASWSAILKAMMKLDPEKQKVMKNTLKELAVVSKDAILDEARKAFDALREKPAEDVGKSNL